MHDITGQTLGQYEIREIIGSGGMATVYRGYQTNLKREVAIKVLPLSLINETGYLERFTREAEIVARLEHPHIVPIVDYGTERNITFVVMRLLTGGNLAQRLYYRFTAGKPLPTLSEINLIIKQLASALDYAHSKKIIHRDIKPSNVMFDNQGNAYLVDFGIAKLTEMTSGLTGTGMTVGTPLYMAPEQWKNEEVSPATDQYALGIILYALVTGKPPFEAPTPFQLMNKHLTEIPTSPMILRRDITPEINEVMNRAIAKQAAERFPNMTAFAQAFESAVGSIDQPPTYFTTVDIASIDKPSDFKSLPTAGGTTHTEGTYAPIKSDVAPPRTPSTGKTAPTLAETGEEGTVRIDASSGALLVPHRNRLPLAVAGLIILVLVGIVAFLVLGQGDEIDEPAHVNATASALAINASSQTAVAALSTQIVQDTQTAIAALASATSTPSDTPTDAPLDTLTPSDTPTLTLDPNSAARATVFFEQTVDFERTLVVAEIQTQTATLWTDTFTPSDTPSETPTFTPTNTPSYTPTLTYFQMAEAGVTSNSDWQPYSEVLTGVEMVLVPVGEFAMGSNTLQLEFAHDLCDSTVGDQGNCGRRLFENEEPDAVQKVTAPFWIDKTEVSRAMYEECVVAGACVKIGLNEYSTNEPTEAMGGITWEQAATYCEWRGARLPTELEWEYAARGPESLIFPWGNEVEGSLGNHCDVNCGNSSWSQGMRFISEENDDGYAEIAPVESFLDSATWVGALNMAGNVWEWTSSIDKPYPYDATDGREDAADRTSLRIMRGGSFHNAVGNMRTTNRDAVEPTDNQPQFGLRCALSAE